MEMARREDMLINMPHPRTKGSTGYPDSVKDLPFFSDPHYQGVGFRWGMGLDRSEVAAVRVSAASRCSTT